MSVLFENWLKVTPTMVVVTSLLGSPHCVGMCGGLILASTRTRFEILKYHFSRLLGYLLLGMLAGLLGQSVLNHSAFKVIPTLTTLALAFGFIWMGFKVGRGRPVYFFKLPSTFFARFQQIAGKGPIATGFLSAFLPCGWLHTFVLGAIASGSITSGGLYLALFWLGTLPALTLTSGLVVPFFTSLRLRSPRLAGLLLMTFGFAGIFIKVFPLYHPNTESSHSCH